MGARWEWPDPRQAPADEPLGVGGDLEPETLRSAYRLGIFPWPSGRDLYWWSPDPRAVIEPGRVHVSRSLDRTLRRGELRPSLVTDPTVFDAVVAGCTARTEGTWITGGMRQAYGRLHREGGSAAVAVHDPEGALVGGIYGVRVGAVFAAESMFHRTANASKVALVHLSDCLAAAGFTLLDVQLMTEHLRSMGAHELPRDAFLERLTAARDVRPALLDVAPRGTGQSVPRA